MANEALDAVSQKTTAVGMHLVAAATLAAKGATRAELELARAVLLQAPERDDPREIESIATSFNRHMDAAIESCNASAGMQTRAMRRAMLARDLERCGILLVDKDYLAGLIADRLSIELTHCQRPVEEGEEFGAEVADGEFIGDVGGDPLRDAYEDPRVND